MKNLNSLTKIMALALLVSVSISSCSDEFLEVEPKGSLIASNTNDYHLLLNNLTLLNLTGNTAIQMSPEVCMLEPHEASASLLVKNAFSWKADIYEPESDITEILDYVRQIYVFNKIINEVPGSKEGTEAEKKSIRAEALAGRAWCYFQLINYFGKPYNPATAATDLGFPILTEADVTQTVFVRATVQEVYDFMLNDLNEAMPDLPEMFWRLRMSKGAGRALLGKVHVFMGNYADGLTELNAAFNLFNNAPLETGLYDYNITMLPGGIHAPSLFGPASVLAPYDIEGPYRKQMLNFHAFIQADILLSPEASALYGPTDKRLTNYFSKGPLFAPPFSVPTIYRRAGALTALFGIHIPDMYLLRAECKARTGDLTGAVADVQYLREHRMPVADAGVPNGLSQTDLIYYIMDERMREYAVQGYEWFTTRRLFNDPLFSNRTYTHKIYAADGSVKETFTLTEERLVLRFNQKIILSNPDLVNNP